MPLSRKRGHFLSLNWLKFLSGTAILGLMAACLWVQYGGPSGLARATYCAWCRHAALTPAYRFAGFFDISTVPQEIDYAHSTNWTLKQEAGRSFLTPVDPSKPAYIRVRIKKEFDDYVFFPRVAEGGEVSVCEATPYAVLFHLDGLKIWSPVGRRYVLNLKCSEFGDTLKQIHVSILIVLFGKNSQVWISSGNVFFR